MDGWIYVKVYMNKNYTLKIMRLIYIHYCLIVSSRSLGIGSSNPWRRGSIDDGWMLGLVTYVMILALVLLCIVFHLTRIVLPSHILFWRTNLKSVHTTLCWSSWHWFWRKFYFIMKVCFLSKYELDSSPPSIVEGFSEIHISKFREINVYNSLF